MHGKSAVWRQLHQWGCSAALSHDMGTAGVMRRLMRVDLGFPTDFAKCELMAFVQFPVVDSFPSLTATALIC